MSTILNLSPPESREPTASKRSKGERGVGEIEAPPRVVIIDDDPALRETLEELIASWSMEVRTYATPQAALNALKPGDLCHVVILDIHFPGGNGLESLPELKARFPGAKIIMITGGADKDSAIRALKLGAFDYIEKPFEANILRHALQKALDAKRKEEQIFDLLQRLRIKEQTLREQNRRLEHLNDQLLKTNKAMAVLAQNISREREETERRLATQLRGVIMPIVQRLALDHRIGPKIRELETALNHLIDDLISGHSLDSRIVSALSVTELRVASLIRSGLTTDEIARQLNVSTSTVKTHRRNIRKKLKLDDTRVDLRSYFESISPGPERTSRAVLP